MAKNRKDVPVEGMWRQIHRICHHAAKAIAAYPTVTKWLETVDGSPLNAATASGVPMASGVTDGGDAREHRHSELFGVDVMMDASGKVGRHRHLPPPLHLRLHLLRLRLRLLHLLPPPHPLQVWLLEYNNSPGLEYCDSHETGECPDAGWNDEVTKQICHDRLAVLGMDREHCDLGDASRFTRVC